MAGVDVLATAFNGANARVHRRSLRAWVADPASVDPSFGELFAALNDEARAVLTDASGASWAPRHFAVGDGPADGLTSGKRPWRRGRGSPLDDAGSMAPLDSERIRAATLDSIRALMLIRAYRVRGHLEAQLDPLGTAGAEAASGARSRRATASPTPTWTGRSSSTTCSAARPRPCARSSRSCARPIAARSASSSCTSRTRTRKPGSSGASRARRGARRSTADAKRTILQPAHRGRGLRDVLPESVTSAPSASAWKAAKSAIPALHTIIDTAAAGGVERDLHRHAASRPAEHAGQHRARSR